MVSLDELLLQAEAAYKHNDYKLEQSLYEQAIHTHTNCIIAYEHLIEINTRQQKFCKAVEYFTKVHNILDSITPEKYLDFAEYLLKNSALIEVEKVLYLGIEKNPCDLQLYQKLISYYIQTNQVSKVNSAYITYHEIIMNKSIAPISDNFSELPENARIGFIGNTDLILAQIDLIRALRPDISVLYILRFDIESDYEKEFIHLKFNKYDKYIKRINTVISCGADTIHAINMLKTFYDPIMDIPNNLSLFISPTLNTLKDETGYTDAEIQTLVRAMKNFEYLYYHNFYHEHLAANKDRSMFYLQKLKFQHYLSDAENRHKNLVYFLHDYFTQREISFILMEADSVYQIEEPTESEQVLARDKKKMLMDLDDTGQLLYPQAMLNIYPHIQPDKVNKYAKELINLTKSWTAIDTVWGRSLSDFNSNFININDGRRRVTATNNQATNSIFIIGNSRVLSPFVEDKFTIASRFQELINKIDIQNSYKVVNYAINGINPFELAMQIMNLDIKPNDIVVFSCSYSLNKLHTQNHLLSYDEIFSTDELANILYFKAHLGRETRDNLEDIIFYDYCHYTQSGNRIIAEQLYKYIFTSLDATGTRRVKQNLSPQSNYQKKIITQYFTILQNRNKRILTNSRTESMQSYINLLQELQIPRGINGSIVMNCNPFTYGHLYLIEYAAQRVDNLIIFVLEEDLSYFKFKDRIDLVRKGTAHLDNVHIVQSGNFVISTVTFPEYFNKESVKNIDLDASHDLTTFCEFIAPAINITKRFIGMEPNCQVTNQYNSQIKQVLPKYGISVDEIPRKQIDGNIISASLVRKHLKNKDFQSIEKFVPKSTFEFLLAKFA